MDGKEQIDRGGKINLPHQCLEELVRMRITYPMMFKVTNPVTGLSSHCGVLEFVSPTDTVVTPFWLMEHLGVAQGGNLKIESASLQRGTFIRIQPQQKAFTDLSDPKAVLESRMNNYSCLTQGDMISIHYQNRSYPILIKECKVGENVVDAISIVEANVNVDFDRPADMPPSPVNKPMPPPSGYSSAKPAATGVSFGNTLLDRAEAPSDASGGEKKPDPPSVSSSGFVAFGGQGNSLSGAKPGGPIGGTIPPRNAAAAKDSLGRALKSEPEKKDGFQAFGGSGRSLK